MRVLLLFAAICLLAAGNANAYLDPDDMQQGMFQYLVSGLVAVILYFGASYKKANKFFSGLFGPKEKKH